MIALHAKASAAQRGEKSRLSRGKKQAGVTRGKAASSVEGTSFKQPLYYYKCTFLRFTTSTSECTINTNSFKVCASVSFRSRSSFRRTWKHGSGSWFPRSLGAPGEGLCPPAAALAAEASARLTAASSGHRHRAAPRSIGRLADPGERHWARKPQVCTSSASPARPPPMPCCLCATHVPRNVFW